MFDIEIIRDTKRFLELESEWRDLADAHAGLTYFLTWEFISSRWKYFSADRELWVLTARGDSGELVGIAPWAISTTRIGPVNVRRLEFLCRAEHAAHIHPYDGEDLDIIAEPAMRPLVTAAFIEQLSAHRSSWDVIDFAWLSSNSNLVAHEQRIRSTKSPRQISTCYLTALPNDWSTYEETVLGKSHSRRIRRHARRLERDYPGEVDYHLISEREQVGPAMDHLIALNLRRWTDVGQQTVFDDDRFIQFHREFVERAFDRGWLRFFQLRVGDQVIAATCGTLLGKTYYLFQKGFDPAWSRYGPGVIMQAYELQKAIEEGCETYDWAPGAVESKELWMNTARDDVRSLAATSIRGNLVLGKEVGISQGKNVLRRLLPESAYQRLKRIATSSGDRATFEPSAGSD